ncbi:MAG: 50S ribosomal protein L9 [Buchnera aphidicola (Schlechtendalia peitan)]
MQIILLNKVESLGNLGDIVRVKSGYARNFLIPHGNALIATKLNIALVLKKKMEFEQKLLDKLSLAQFRAKKIQEVCQPVIIFSKSRKEGKLFGSVGTREISEVLSKLCNVEVRKGEIRISGGIIRNIGEYNITFKPHSNVSVVVNIKIVSKDE